MIFSWNSFLKSKHLTSFMALNTQPHSQICQIIELWVLICTGNLTVCYHYVMYAFQIEPTLYQILRRDRSSQDNPILWPAFLNGWVYVYKLSACGFKFRCSHINFRYLACFKQEVPWHSGNYRMQLQSEKHTWHDKNIQSNAL